MERFDKSWAARCEVFPVERRVLQPMIEAHYLGKWPGVVVCSLVLRCDGVPVGAVVFALPPRETSKRYGATTWELARLWVSDDMPHNTETWLVARALKHVQWNCPDVGVVVSYVDPSAGHAGTIYKAGNWIADGRTDDDRKTPRFDYAHPETGKVFSRRKHVPAGVVPVRVPRVSKHRFYFDIRT